MFVRGDSSAEDILSYNPAVSKNPNPGPWQFKVGDRVSVTLHTGLLVDAAVRAIVEKTDGVRLQVDYGKDETALVELWRVHPK